MRFFTDLRTDMRAIFERDPAAKSNLEVLLCYPGLKAIVRHRVAHYLYNKKWFLLARLVSHFNRFLTGIEIHPGAIIGQGVFIDHGLGVVIGETAVVGDNVTIYQGVTLGGTGKDKGKRHPTIGNQVVISTGAKILGAITIGNNCKIGAGSVVLKDVPDDCTVVGVPGRIVSRAGISTQGVDLEHHRLPDPVSEALIKMQAQIEDLQNQVNLIKREAVS